MRLIFFGIAAALAACSPAVLSAEEQTLQQKLQGEWSRSNAVSRFVIKGNKCAEYKATAPLKVHTTGQLEYPPEKDHALARFTNGWTVWFFSAGRDAIAIEAFNPKGELNGIGQILYRHGSGLEAK